MPSDASLPQQSYSPRMVALGNGHAPEFAELRLQAMSRCADGFAREWPSISAFLADHDLPDLLIVWQATPDEYSPDEVLALLSRIPLTRVVCVYGDWCESAGRTRQTWPLAVRVPKWLAISRLRVELRSLMEFEVTAVPWTAAREEVWLRDRFATQLPQLTGITAHLDVADRAYREGLTDLLTSTGAVIAAAAEATQVVIVDIEPWTESTSQRLQDWVADDPERLVIGISGWITSDLEATCLDLGCAAVVPKLDPDALVTTLAELLELEIPDHDDSVHRT